MPGWNISAIYSLFAGAALKSMAVLGAAWLAAILLRGRSAAARHLVWTAAFAALVALPFLSLSLPALRVPVSSTVLPPGVAFETSASASPEASASQASPQAAAAARSRIGPWNPDLRLLLMLLWSAGAAVGIAQMLLAWARMWRVRRRASRFADADVAPLMDALAIDHEVEVLETGRGSMPMTFGLLRPAVFVPADAAEWSQDRRRMVLLHELAHVRRGDLATHLLARMAFCFYWWNPLAWAAWREFLKERERATDDLVLSAGARPSEYAGHLLEIARAMQSPPALGWAAVAMARRSQLEGRLLAILDSGRNRKSQGRASVWTAALAAIIIVAPLAALRAQEKVPQALPADVDATIRAAAAQRNPEMLEKAAKAAEASLKYEMAQNLLESSLAIRADVSGEQSVEYGAVLLKLARLERRRGRLDAAEIFYKKAVSVLDSRPEAAPALIDLGTLALMQRDVERAIEYFQQAQVVDPAKAGPPLMWMAVAREHQNNIEETESLYKRVLAIEDANSAEAATTMEIYALFLRRQGREEEAKSMQDQATSLRRTRGGSVASARQGASPEVYRAGNGVTAPALLSKIEPEYTEEARLAKYEGTVELYLEVGADGLAHNIKVQRGLGLGLDEKAIEAINQWKFKPGTKNGQPVTVAALVTVNFRLL